jgi:peptidoglycan/LPS O-acetylase OafA/YrhL
VKNVGEVVVLQEKQTANRDNNFNLLRILAAGAVLVSHAYPICLGPDAIEPFDRVLGMSLGTLAVLTFFVISGYFISQSFCNRHSVVEFTVARALRIYPGLLTVLVLTVFALGPIFTKTDLTTYFLNPETFLYIPRNLRLWRLQYELPGVFNDNPYPNAINGSLWTLAYEVACYALVAVVGIFGLARDRVRFVGFVTAYAVCYVAALPLLRSNHSHVEILRNFHLLSLPFVMGMALFQFRQFMPLRLPILLTLGAAAAISYERPWFHELFVLVWSYGVFYLGFLQYKPLLAYNRLGDYSYGTYIYAFPVGQIIAALYHGCTPFVMIALSLAPTLLLAILSWHCIEERALAKKSTVTARLRRSVISPTLSSSR